MCQYKPKRVQLGGLGCQFECSPAGADPENIVSGRGKGGLSLTDVLVVLYLLFTTDHSKGTKFLQEGGGESKFSGRCVGWGRDGMGRS